METTMSLHRGQPHRPLQGPSLPAPQTRFARPWAGAHGLHRGRSHPAEHGSQGGWGPGGERRPEPLGLEQKKSWTGTLRREECLMTASACPPSASPRSPPHPAVPSVLATKAQ